MTIDTALVLKAAGAETSGTDGTGAALDLGGDFGPITALVNVTAVAGNPPSGLGLVFEASHNNSNWFVVGKGPTITAPGQYRVAINAGEAADRGRGLAITSTGFYALGLALRKNPRYLRKTSVVTAGTGGDSVTYSIHVTA